MGDFDTGRHVLAEMLGEVELEKRDQLIADGAFGATSAKLSLEYCFGGVWARTGLDRNQRSLVTLGILIALRLPDQLQNHIRIALSNGVTIDEIEEILVHSTAYVGFAAAGAASNAVGAALRDLGLVP